MKISVSLPEDDVAFLDAYAEGQGLPSRSAALNRAVRLLRSNVLGSAYEAAWSEWEIENEPAWSSATSDGLQ